MSARFLLKAPPGVDEKGEPHAPVEYVELPGANGKDVVCRRATDLDRSQHRPEYLAFKAPTVAPTDETPKSAAGARVQPPRPRR